MDWLDHDRLGFNYRLTDIACALDSRSWIVWTACSPTARGPAGWYRSALAGFEGALELPCEDFGGDVRGSFVFVVQLPQAPIATTRSALWRCVACSPSRICPRFT